MVQVAEQHRPAPLIVVKTYPTVFRGVYEYTYNMEAENTIAQDIAGRAFYGGCRLQMGAIFRELCRWKGTGIIEAEVCPDRIHMLSEILPKYSVSFIVGYFKAKSRLTICARWGNAKF